MSSAIVSLILTMSTSDSKTQGGGTTLVEELAAADDALTEARERVAEFGESDLQQLADAYDEFTALLDRYEEPATGDGNFETFIEFQGKVEQFVERLDEDILLRESFEEADNHLQQRRLSESDFAHVREQLQPVADLAARLDERREASERYERTRKRIRTQIRELNERIDDLERLQHLGDADLDAPTERLRDPIDTYNDAVTEAFEEFRREEPAREVFAFLEATTAYPLVPFRRAPEELRSYVAEHPPGTEPIPELLEYAGYSRSKLDHYVEDAGALKQAVGTQKTYLRRLDADPLTIGWPPPTATELRWRCQELTAVVNRFAPAVVEYLRTVAALPRETDYQRLRDSAVAEAELSTSERERLRTGAVTSDLEEARESRERLRAALEEYPSR
jgi:hypothetical protein